MPIIIINTTEIITWLNTIVGHEYSLASVRVCIQFLKLKILVRASSNFFCCCRDSDLWIDGWAAKNLSIFNRILTNSDRAPLLIRDMQTDKVADTDTLDRSVCETDRQIDRQTCQSGIHIHMNGKHDMSKVTRINNKDFSKSIESTIETSINFLLKKAIDHCNPKISSNQLPIHSFIYLSINPFRLFFFSYNSLRLVIGLVLSGLKKKTTLFSIHIH